MTKIELFSIFGKHIPNSGIAKDPDLERDKLYFLPTGKHLLEWHTLRCKIIRGERFYDYQASTHSLRLCSQQLKDILESNKSVDDNLQWLDVTITWNGETRPYYVLHFPENIDVLDDELSAWDGMTPNKSAVYVREKIANHNIFSIPKSSLSLVVRPQVIKEIKKEKLTGMVYRPAKVVSINETYCKTD
jgi:hypothetical protein